MPEREVKGGGGGVDGTGIARALTSGADFHKPHVIVQCEVHSNQKCR